MSRCGFSWTRSDGEAPRSRGTQFLIFFLFSRGLSLVGFTTPRFCLFQSEFCLGIWFCGNLSSLFSPPNNKDRKQNSGNHAVNKQASEEEEEFWNQSCERGKKKKKYVRMKSGKKKIGKILWGKPPLRTTLEWRKVFTKYCLLHMHRRAEIVFASEKLHSGGF